MPSLLLSQSALSAVLAWQECCLDRSQRPRIVNRLHESGAQPPLVCLMRSVLPVCGLTKALGVVPRQVGSTLCCEIQIVSLFAPAP